MAHTLPLLYLDSSIPSAYYNGRNQERQTLTQHVWHKKIQYYHPVISNITLRELSATPNRRKKRNLLVLVQRLEMLILTPECKNLADEYLKLSAMPINDALHIAIATVFGCEILLSWNFTHLVNHSNRQKVNGVNLIHGYKTVAIISPYEL